MVRTYEKGRPTTGWRKGKRITSPQQVKPGDVLIGVNHQFEAENLYLVVPSGHPKTAHHYQGFYVRYSQPDLTRTNTDFQPQWIWDFQLAHDVWFTAKPNRCRP
jgi:hypothetical protein